MNDAISRTRVSGARARRTAAASSCGLALLLLVAIGAGGVAPADADDIAPPPAEAFGALPANTDVTLSPDGRRLAWVDNTELKPRVEMFDIDARKPLRILALPPQLKLRGLAWNDGETLLVSFSATAETRVNSQVSKEFFVTIAYDASGGEGRFLPGSSGRERGAVAAAHAGLVRARVSKPHAVIMQSFDACNGVGCLIAVDTTTGAFTLIKAGNEHSGVWVVDWNGRALAREDWDWKKRAYRVYALDGNNVKEILRKDDSEQPTLVGALADDSALVLLAANGRPHRAAWALPLDGSPARLLADDPDADITDVSFDADGAVAGVYISGSKTTMHWLDPRAQQRHEVLQRAFPGRDVTMSGWSTDGKRMLAAVESPSSPPVYYLVDLTTHRADIAAEAYPALAHVMLGGLREISYQARDGTAIPAYLTLPPGKRAGPGPLVVLPHGGPNARDYPTFDWLVQFLATRGYAVLQPQFRGSTGFGEVFERAGYRQWGGLMQDDVTDGVRAMIEQGIADPHHICIVGASYGGYAALAGAAFTPKLYACAVSINGVSDLRAMLQDQVLMFGSAYGVGYRYISTWESNWKERVGSETDPALATRSPINSVAAITIPVLIAYGSGDGVVANEQSIRMAKAMSKAGKAVTLVKLPDEDHWLSRADTRTQLLKELESFLKQHF
jgi:dipeptidyl aminopeptidase/acylaminoacyl peptidase